MNLRLGRVGMPPSLSTKNSQCEKLPMKFVFLHQLPITLSVALLLAFGCSKEVAPPKPITVEQAHTSLEEVFKGAGPEVKKLVEDAVGALAAKDYAKALFALQALGARSDLTPPQRDLASRSMLAVNQALAEQASTGDQKAQQVLQFQRTTK